MKMYATSNRVHAWEDIDIPKAESHVKKLQKRIAAAYQDDDPDRVASLQHKMIHSFYAKALAVKVVTSKKGKDTPGVDDVLWVSPQDKYDAVCQLRRRGYHPMPLKRVYIPKPHGGVRPLSIPTMKDRAMQTLYRFALEPIGQLTADTCSFAYLPGRGARDAIVHLADVLMERPDFRWMMKADIKACFDNIDHRWVMEHIPMDKEILRKFLTCGYVENSTFHPTERGVPQGGCISATICNMVLDGLEALLEERFGLEVKPVRYADDIIIVGQSRKTLVQAVTPVVETFLSERGLSLSSEKTGYYPVHEKVHFLGWEVHKEGDNLIAAPSENSIAVLLGKVAAICQKERPVSFQVQRQQIEQRVRGWLNYYAGIAPLQSLNGAEFEVVTLIQRLTGSNRLAEYTGAIFARYSNL